MCGSKTFGALDSAALTDEAELMLDEADGIMGEASIADVDDDPQCVCGVYRSEHSMMGCPEGFQTAEQWEIERRSIIERAKHDDDGYVGDDWSSDDWG